MMPIMNFVGNLGYVAVAIVGSIFAANGTITIGDIQAFIQYVKNFNPAHPAAFSGVQHAAEHGRCR